MNNLNLNYISHSEFKESNVLLCCLADNNVCFYKSDGCMLSDNNVSFGNVQDALDGRDCKLDYPIFLGYSGILNKIILVFGSGDILSTEITDGSFSLEGTIEDGLVAGSLSPGEDLIGLVSSQLSLIVLDSEFDHIFETDLHGEGQEQSVNVGWGKKETQFRGTEGKLKANKELPVLDNVKDDGKVRLSWRGDGEYLAASIRVGNQRFIKVVSKDGQLVHSSEAVIGLESAFNWRPNGSLIASSQRLPNKHVICFFEKNTLPHGQFELIGDWSVRELLWSCDSSVLAAILDGVSTQIQIFTFSNYHWYHKFTIKFEKEDNLLWAVWETADPLVLHIFVSTLDKIRHTRYSWRSTIDGSRGSSTNNQAFVNVIDGSRLLLTSFRRGIIPPPMSSYVIEFTKPINAVGFRQSDAENESLSSNDFFILQNDGLLSFYNYNDVTKKHESSLEFLLQNRNIFQLSWINDKIILGCEALSNGKHQLCVINIPEKGGELSCDNVDVPHPLTVIRRKIDGLRVLLCDSNLKFSLFDLEKRKVELLPIDVPKCKGKILAVEMTNVPLVLDSASTLFAGPQAISSGVTSMHLHDNMVLATTLKHKLLCIPLDNPSAMTERAVEPGARLVTVISHTGKVVIQMPRGNLEVVQPRALVLRTLKYHLDEFRFGEAFAIMRRERINLNLLCDHNRDNFANQIEQFLDAVKDPTALCTFIAELMPEDVTRTMYEAFYLNQSPLVESFDKVRKICSLIIAAIEKHPDPDRLFLVVLSCLTKMDDAGSALLRIKKVVDAEHTGKKFVVSGAEGLRHIMYLIDIEQLFKVALGTYDLDLVMYVASKSQKDPKEYVPFLSNLQAMESNYQRFTIDKFLKRYSKALEHIVKCPGKLTECLELIEAHKLYQRALALLPIQAESYKAVCLKYGEELQKLKRHEEEGVILLQGGHFKLALYAFTRSGNWRQVLYCANVLKYTREQLTDLYTNLASSLRNEKRYEDAAKLLLDYVDDVSGAVEALSSAHLFEEALRVCRLREKEELIQYVVGEGKAAAESLMKNITTSTDIFKERTERLKVVKVQKLDEEEVDWDDMQSESSKGSSRGSRTTTVSRSAKNSRKLERKLLSLKEGGAFEDLALIVSLHDLATQVVSFIPQVRSINLFLMLVGELDTASALQSALRTCLNVISRLIPEIWQPLGASDGLGQNATSNSIAASWTKRTQSAMPAPIQAVQPKLLFPPNLSTSVQWEFSVLKADES